MAADLTTATELYRDWENICEELKSASNHLANDLHFIEVVASSDAGTLRYTRDSYSVSSRARL
jgi:hypothetical protein